MLMGALLSCSGVGEREYDIHQYDRMKSLADAFKPFKSNAKSYGGLAKAFLEGRYCHIYMDTGPGTTFAYEHMLYMCEDSVKRFMGPLFRVYEAARASLQNKLPEEEKSSG
jgi:hypothetical protein